MSFDPGSFLGSILAVISALMCAETALKFSLLPQLKSAYCLCSFVQGLHTLISSSGGMNGEQSSQTHLPHLLHKISKSRAQHTCNGASTRTCQILLCKSGMQLHLGPTLTTVSTHPISFTWRPFFWIQRVRVGCGLHPGWPDKELSGTRNENV